jgi:hypothetical protein
MPSSVIRRFRYFEDERTLRIWFVSGSAYDYLDLPPEEHEALKAAFSKGQFFAERIRPVYRCRRLGEPAVEGRSSPSV